MNDNDVVYTCPLGSECRTIRDNKEHVCRWYKQIKGMNPNTGEQIDTWDCAISWMPLLTIENATTNRGQTQALESFRNEVVKGHEQELTLKMLAMQKE